MKVKGKALSQDAKKLLADIQKLKQGVVRLDQLAEREIEKMEAIMDELAKSGDATKTVITRNGRRIGSQYELYKHVVYI